MRRREFLKAATIAALGLTTVSSASSLLPSPDLSEDLILRFVAGLRPYRRQAFRLEREPLEDKLVIHNYGHGGCGITLSWGCAEEVLGWLPEGPVAVLGSGVMGLTCAFRAAKAGRSVTIYARDFPPHTTSNVAGGLWSPTGISPGDPERFTRILRTAHQRYSALEGPEWGVRSIDHYEARGQRPSAIMRVPRDLVPMREWERLPFDAPETPGYSFRTFLVEPPVLLPRLLKELSIMGVKLVPRTFESVQEVLSLREPTVVNCMGLGAGAVFRDPLVLPIRGQLVHLKPQSLPYTLVRGAYLFPRRDAVVLGGTYERGRTVAQPCKRDCLHILHRHQRFFGGWFSNFT